MMACNFVDTGPVTLNWPELPEQPAECPPPNIGVAPCAGGGEGPPPACPNAAFPHQISNGGPYCYNDASFAAGNSGPCESWCTTDASAGDGCGGCCGDISAKLCSLPAHCSANGATSVVRSPVCPNPAFPHPMAAGGPWCYNNPTWAARNSGPCESWCSTDPSADDGCGG